MANGSTPVLSVVIAAGNVGDDGGPVSPLIGALRFNHEQLSAHGVRHEVVLVDCNPSAERPWLADVAMDAVPTLRDETLVSIVVDPLYRDAIGLDVAVDGFESVMRNIGIRRARGSFILSASNAVCLGRGVLRRIAEGTIEAGVLYRAPRVDVRLGVARDIVGWTLLEQPQNVTRRPRAPQPPLYLDGAGDFVLLDRASFHELRGLDEVYGLPACNVANNLVLKAYSNGCAIQSLGAPVYQIHEGPTSAVTPQQDDAAAAKAPRQDRDIPRPTYVNPDTWGLSAAPERQLGPHRIWLDFDWTAVPPLVDLSRVVLPQTRLGVGQYLI